jgi:hypothetical protein
LNRNYSRNIRAPRFHRLHRGIKLNRNISNCSWTWTRLTRRLWLYEM